MVTCAGCGSPLPDDARKCEQCGRPRGRSDTGALTLNRASARQSLLERVQAVTASRYDVRGEIGRGGMAAVFVARDLRLNRRVALKVMLPGLAFSEGMAERFEQEARTAANLDHPNIVTIYGVEEYEEIFCFVMKYVEGRSLDKVTRDLGALPVDVAQYLLLKVVMALAYAHDEGVIHRDVKPGNVLLDRRGNPVVTDFGIAKAAESPSLTVTGSIIGTPAYMSPEQFSGESALPASDQYALGIMAYEMLAGEVPFQGTMLELQLAHIQRPAVPIDQVRRDVPAGLAAIVMRMLEKEPARRFPSLHETEAALRTLPLDEDAARTKLVELGFLSSTASPFGLASSPGRSAPGVAARDAKAREGSGEGPAPRGEPLAAASPPAAGGAQAPAPDIPRVAYVRIEPITGEVLAGEVIPLRGAAYDEFDTPIPGKQLSWEVSPPGIGELNADGTLTVMTAGTITLTAMCDGRRSDASEVKVTPLPANRGAQFVATVVAGAPGEKAPAPLQTPPSRAVADATPSAPTAPSAPTVLEGASARRRGAPAVEGAGAVDPAGQAPTLIEPATGGETPAGGFDARRALTVSAGVSGAVLVGLLAVFLLKGRPTTRSAPVAAPPAETVVSPASPQSPPDGGAESAPADGRVGSGAGVGTEIVPPGSDVAANGASAVPPAPSAAGAAPPGTSGPTSSSAVASLEIVNPPSTLGMGERARLRVTARDAQGASVPSPRTVWRSSDERVLRVAGSGEVEAVRPGLADVEASSGSVSARISLRVRTPRLTALSIGSVSPLEVGGTANVQLSAQSDAGVLSREQLGAMGMAPRWSSSSPAVARVDGRSGEVTAVAPGSATIRAEAGDVSAVVAVRVVAPAAVAGAPATPPPASANPTPVPASPPPTASSTPPRDPAPPPAPAARTEGDVSREVEATLREYADAVSARDLTALLRLFPTMAERDRGTWRQFFSESSDVKYDLVRVDLARPIDTAPDGQVTVTRRWSLGFALKGQSNRGQTSGQDRVTLKRSANGWLITRIQ